MLLALFAAALATGFRARDEAGSAVPGYTADGRLEFPEHYRDWVYLSSGFDMSYLPAQNADHHVFDNVFANPEAYAAFLKTGSWPEKTLLVLEVRGAQARGSINQGGSYQGSDVVGLEVHIKDSARFPGKWAFFSFENGKAAHMIPQSAACYSCHAAHAAVDTTFVQFYPTLLPLARSRGSLSAAYVKESGTADR